MFPSPTLVPPELEDFQFSYNGLVFGAETPFGVLGVDGLDFAEVRSGDVNLPRDHGQFAGLDVFGGRDVTFDFWIVPGGTSLQARQLELAAAANVMPNQELPLWFQLPNLPLLCVMCRPRKRPLKIDSDYAAAQVAKPEMMLHATDPRIYGEGQSTAFAWGSEASPTEVTITNEGNTEMRPVLVLNGPLWVPRMENSTLDTFPDLGFDRAFGENPTVKAGDQLYVSLGTPHLIEYYETHSGKIFPGGGDNVSEWLTGGSEWWDIIPGANVFKFRSKDASDPGGSAEIQWASAYEF